MTTAKDIPAGWRRFVDNCSQILIAFPDAPDLQHFMPFKEQVFAIARGEEFDRRLVDTVRILRGGDDPLEDMVDALGEEIDGMSRAIEIAQSTTKPASKRWFSRAKALIPKASTVTGSCKDILGADPYLSMGFTLVKELLDLFDTKA